MYLVEHPEVLAFQSNWVAWHRPVKKGRSMLQNEYCHSGYRGNAISDKPGGTGFLTWKTRASVQGRKRRDTNKAG